MSAWPYNTDEWRELRARKLEATPKCELCPPDIRRKATCVDHKVPVRMGGPPFPALSGLWSSCWSCHSAKTARGPERGAAHTTKPMKGCGLDGLPLDASHPFNARTK